MPDWFYRTLSQKVLFALPPATGRDLALRLMGGVARLPGGVYIIDVLGHMIPDARLTVRKPGLSFATPVGIGYGLDMRLAATRALRRFGAGVLEVGPIGLLPSETRIERDTVSHTLRWQGRHQLALLDAVARLPRQRDPRTQVMARIAAQNPTDWVTLIDGLRDRADLFACEGNHVPWAMLKPHAGERPLLAVIDATDKRAAALASAALAAGADGVLLSATCGGCFGPQLLPGLHAALRSVRAVLGPDACVLAAGGVHDPQDVLDTLDAGADVAMVDSGLVFSGPGLIKRSDDALMHRLLASQVVDVPSMRPVEAEPKRDWLQCSWFWQLLLGMAMFLGGLMATAIALGPVLLPYDEAFVGLSIAQIHAFNPHLLDFMTHDRITLAGVMLTVGFGYAMLAWHGARKGWHWAEGVGLLSAGTGVLAFFSFLGFGYLEPFHAFVTGVLTQFWIAAFRSRLDPPTHMPQPALRETPAWRRALWGQLCWVLFGFGLLLAGAAITLIGINGVFVPSDLAFMGSTTAKIDVLSPRLLPLIAHDRATVGNMLIASGLLYLCSALWAFRRGERWFWWMLLLSTLPAFACVIWVHLHVGYIDALHLAPVWGAIALVALGAALSHEFCFERETTST